MDIVIKSECVLRKISDGYLLVPICGEIASEGTLFELNEVGADIWEIISTNEKISLKKLEDIILEKYEVEIEELRKDITDILAVLRVNKVIF